MFKSIRLVTAAAVSLTVAGAAQAQPRPRFPTRLPAVAAASVQTAPAPVAAAPVQVEPAAAAEPPRAAPLGAVQAVELPVVSQPSPATASETAPAPPDAGPAAAAPVEPAPAPAPGPRLTHVVAEGDTFYAIARRYGVGPQAVADANGLALGPTLRVGQRIALPAGALDRGPEAAFPAVRTLAPSAPAPAVRSLEPPQASAQPLAAPTPVPAAAAVQPSAPPPLPVQQPPEPRSAAPAPGSALPTPAPTAPPMAPPVIAAPTESPPAPSAPLTMAWPVQGPILAPFGPTGVGQRNDGLRISAPEGASVRAASAGRVVYAGDQVKGGYGKLVLVEHEGRWFTAYAHLADIKVRMQDRVSQGQELGTVGRTGSVAAPQLYFEVRHAPTPGERARPVDPAPLLPQ